MSGWATSGSHHTARSAVAAVTAVMRAGGGRRRQAAAAGLAGTLVAGGPDVAVPYPYRRPFAALSLPTPPPGLPARPAGRYELVQTALTNTSRHCKQLQNAMPLRMARRAVPENSPFQLTRAARRSVPALTAAFVTLLYAVGYLVWERNDWGTPVIRNLVSNVAFMPLNLAVVTLTFARLALAGAGPRRAPGAAAARARLGDGLHRQHDLDLVPDGAAPEPAGLLGRPVLPLRLAPDPRRPALLPARPPHPAGAVEVRARRRDGAGRRRGGDLVLLDPAHRGRDREQQHRHHPARLRLSAGEHAGAARHHHGDPAAADRRQPGRLRPAGRRR